MKPLIYLFIIAGSALIYFPTTSSQTASNGSAQINMLTEKLHPQSFTILPGLFSAQANCENNPAEKLKEGILQTKVSFPGNVLGDLLSEIDFNKADIQGQLQKLQLKTSSEEYAERIEKKMNSLSEEERTAMGKMMMGVMLSPVYAKIYISEKEVLAKAVALNYSMESYMNTSTGKGRMNVLPNYSAENAAIEFSAARMKEVWDKEEVGPDKYQLKEIPGTKVVAGYSCNQTVYTYKQTGKSNTALAKAPHKLIVWHSSEIGKEINFFHPFYFEIDKGILKIEVFYDQAGKVKMVYEVTDAESKKLSGKDFQLTAIQPVLNWDNNQAEASIKILQAMMASQE